MKPMVLGEPLHTYHAWAMAMTMAMPGIYLLNRKSASQLREGAMRRRRSVVLSYGKNTNRGTHCERD